MFITHGVLQYVILMLLKSYLSDSGRHFQIHVTFSHIRPRPSSVSDFSSQPALIKNELAVKAAHYDHIYVSFDDSLWWPW